MRSFALCAIVFAGIFPLGAIAQDQILPALHDVDGVAADDGLNIRQEPSSRSPILGRLDSDQTNVEVIELDTTGRWGRVNTGESAGWVWMRYLLRQDGQSFTEPNRCFGTEPFWSLTFDERGGTFTMLGETGQRLPQMTRVGSTRGPDRMGYVFNDGGSAMIAVVAREACNDTMSDRAYGFAVDLVSIGGRNNRRLHSGCCSISSR